jgi:hypothetical protein
MSHLIGCKNYDHIDRNPLNNRKNNLRKATQSENMRNRSIFSNNKSGVTGVYFCKHHQKWVAQITVDKKQIRLGTFSDKDKAIITRLTAEAKYFGEWAPQKDLFEQYNIQTIQND